MGVNQSPPAAHNNQERDKMEQRVKEQLLAELSSHKNGTQPEHADAVGQFRTRGQHMPTNGPMWERKTQQPQASSSNASKLTFPAGSASGGTTVPTPLQHLDSNEWTEYRSAPAPSSNISNGGSTISVNLPSGPGNSNSNLGGKAWSEFDPITPSGEPHKR